MAMSMTTASSVATSQHLAAMAEAARWAPSVHNTQPWRFRYVPDGLEIHQDPTRSLPALDPTGRLRLLSCAAAVDNAAVQLAARGAHPRVLLLPDPAHPTLVATVSLGRAAAPSPADLADAVAIPARRTHRRLHSHDPVAQDVLTELARVVTREGAHLTVVPPRHHHALATLLTQAARAQSTSPQFLDEVETWVRHWGAAQDAPDGIPVTSLGTAPYPVDSIIQEHTDPSSIRADEVAEVLTKSSVLVITTRGDGPRDWTLAGMAMQRMLLRATTAGLVATFADQATQTTQTRAHLGEALDVLGHPQIVLRLGHPLVDVDPPPRRPLDDVLIQPPAAS